MAGKEYKARDKVVNKMTKEGLTEVNLRDGSVREIDGRSRDRPLKKDGMEEKESHGLENAAESVNAAANKKMRIRRYSSLRQKSLEQKENEEIQGPVSEQEFRDEDPIHSERTVSAKIKFRRYQDRLRDHEMIPEGDDLQNGQSSMKKKQKKIQLTKEQAKAGKLSFDDEGNGMIRGSGLGIRKKGSDIAGTVVSDYMRNKVQEDWDDNAAVEGAGALEHSSGRAASVFRQLHNRYRLSKDRSGRKVYREEEIQKESLRFTPDQKEPNVYPDQKKKERQSILNRFFQRKRYKEAYRSARTGAHAAGTAQGTAAAGGIENATVKAKIALKDIIRKNRAVFAGLGIFGLIFLLIAVSFGSCSASIEGSGSVIGITTYPSSDEDIYAAENAYAALENALNNQINQMESTHPGYDEYQYNLGEITHNPYHLISYLTAKYGDWTYEDVESEIDTLFRNQYALHTEGKTETVTETRTVRVGESIGQVVTSGYCSCSICCGQWAGGPTASGVYPTANHTLAVDASDPIVPIGTKVVMNGVEYTVEDTGAFARYGVDFDVYYADHASALAHGHRTWECYLADDNGENEVTVTNTTTKKILYVTLTNKGLDAIVRELLDEEQLILYNALNTTYGNRNYLWDIDTISGGSGGMDYTIPPEALEDEEFARMIREAEKYLGVPYVWGGYSPSGFDCSGFVSYVINHCGNGWNYGRMTAEGLRGQCTYVPPAEAKPGDLIFFQGTYATSGASHIGIYVGNGMMIHCGDPVQYANINSSYWQQHFMCFGRLP